VQGDERCPVARHAKTPAGVAVEAMHELQVLARARCAQCLDDPKTHTAAAVHGHPGGLVDHQQMLVLKNDRALDERLQTARRAPGLLGTIDVHGRQAYLIARGDPVLGVDALAVDAHLALAQQAVDAAARHPAEMAHEVVVDALARFLRGYGAQLHGGLGAFRRCGGLAALLGFGFHFWDLTVIDVLRH